MPLEFLNLHRLLLDCKFSAKLLTASLVRVDANTNAILVIVALRRIYCVHIHSAACMESKFMLLWFWPFSVFVELS